MPFLHWVGHSAHVMSSVSELYKNLEFTDCSLDTNGGLVYGHRTILAACSPYLKKLFLDHHEMQIIPLKEVKYNIMKLILDVVYFGEVEVSVNDVSPLVEAAGLLQITSLRCNSQNFSEKLFTNNPCDRSITDCGSNCDGNLMKYYDCDLFDQDMKVMCNQDILHENEDRLAANCEAIDLSAAGVYKANPLSDLKELSQTVNEIYPKTHFQNSSVSRMAKVNKIEESFKDELTPSCFVAVSSFSVKSEHVDDGSINSEVAVRSSESKNPLEVYTLKSDTNKEINEKEDGEFLSESDVKIEIKEENDFCEVGDKVTQNAFIKKPFQFNSGAETEGISDGGTHSHEGLTTAIVSNMFLATDNSCSKGHKENGTIIGREASLYLEENVSENAEDLQVKFQSICVVPKSDLKEEKPFETSLDIETHENNGMLLNKVSKTLVHAEEELFNISYEHNLNEGLSEPNTKRLKLKDARLVSERMSPSYQTRVGEAHSVFQNLSGSSKTRIQFNKEENKPEKYSNEEQEDVSGCLGSEVSHDDHLASEAKHSVHSTDNVQDTKCAYENEQRQRLQSDSFQKDKDPLPSDTFQREKGSHCGEKLFSCGVCKVSFPEKIALNLHRRKHVGEKRFKCDVCDSIFSYSNHLKNHLRIHTGEKSFRCDICEQSFSLRGNLKKHLRTHTGEKPFRCDICEQSYSQRSTLKEHLRTHTGEKPFSCDICEHSFSQRGSLKKHLRTHTGEKPFSCGICDQLFSQSSAVTRHLRTHTGEKQFRCDICEQSFSERRNLKKHLRTHTA